MKGDVELLMTKWPQETPVTFPSGALRSPLDIDIYIYSV